MDNPSALIKFFNFKKESNYENREKYEYLCEGK